MDNILNSRVLQRPASPNSTGVTATMVATGSAVVADDNVTLTASISPNNFGFFITSQFIGGGQRPPGSEGNVCVGADAGRFLFGIQNSGPAGVIEISTTTGHFSLSAIPRGPGPYAAVPGGSAHFQAWFRDHNPFPTSNFTDGIVVTWQ